MSCALVPSRAARNKAGMPHLPAWTRPVLDFALPPRCPGCGVTVEEDHRFCLDCWQQLDFITEPFCERCGTPFAYARTAGAVCARCLTDPPEHDGVRAAVIYDDHSRQVAMRLKYGGRIGHARLIAQHLLRHCTELPPDSLLVPVPLHRWRLWSRGFNQSQLIVAELHKLSRLPLAVDLLRRKKATPPLRGLSGAERRRSVAGAFALAPRAADRVRGRTIILVDDVYTSGATANACAAELRRGGAAKILIFCWARVVDSID